MKLKNPFLSLFLALCVACIAMTPNLSYAFDLFIEVEGIPGESTDSNHENWIDGLSYSAHVESDPITKASCFGDLTIVKYLDKASPKLSLAAANGTQIPEVNIEFCRTFEGQVCYYKIKLEKASVTSVSDGGTAGENVPSEQVTFYFETITWTYTILDDTGNPAGTVEESFVVTRRCEQN